VNVVVPALKADADKSWVWLFCFGLATRLVFILLAENNGTDAYARYLTALSILKDPGHVPSEVWLPFHLWLLAAVLSVWSSEVAARLFTAMLGALTLLPFWGLARRAFDPRTAFYSTLVFALFGFHVGYSVTTSSEVPTIFLLVLGVYGWLRFEEGSRWGWVVLAASAFSAACLSRYEAWLYVIVLGIALLGSAPGWRSTLSNRRGWMRVLGFGFPASIGALGWMLFSYVTWGDPLWSAHRTLSLNLNSPAYMNVQNPLTYRLAVVPGVLAVTLSPLILCLAVVGIVTTLRKFTLPASALAGLVLVLSGMHYFNAVYGHVTMARYTLMYSWLLIPFAFIGLAGTQRWWPRISGQKVWVAVVIFALAWQGGVLAGSYWGPEVVGDKLSAVAPTLPPRHEIRRLARWLQAHATTSDTLIVDEFNYESVEILRSGGMPASSVFVVPATGDSRDVERQLTGFVKSRHPRLLVYCFKGRLSAMWALPNLPEIELTGFGMRLRELWRGSDYRVYEIEYGRGSDIGDR